MSISADVVKVDGEVRLHYFIHHDDVYQISTSRLTARWCSRLLYLLLWYSLFYCIYVDGKVRCIPPYIVLACIVMAHTVMANIVMACIVVSHIVMARIATAHIAMAGIVMACDSGAAGHMGLFITY